MNQYQWDALERAIEEAEGEERDELAMIENAILDREEEKGWAYDVAESKK